MTKNELKRQINSLATEFCQTHVEMAFGNHDKAALERGAAKLTKAVEMVREARAIIASYAPKQWECAIIFGVGQTGVNPSDLTKVHNLMAEADQLWQSNLWR